MRCRVYFVCLVSHTHIHAHTHTHTGTLSPRDASRSFPPSRRCTRRTRTLRGLRTCLRCELLLASTLMCARTQTCRYAVWVCRVIPVGVLRPRGSRPGLNPMLRIRCKHGANTLRTSRQCVIYGARVYLCCLCTKPRDRPYRTQGGR